MYMPLASQVGNPTGYVRFEKCTCWCNKLITMVLLEQCGVESASASAQTGSAGMPPIHPAVAGCGAGDVASLLLIFPFLLRGSHEPLALH